MFVLNIRRQSFSSGSVGSLQAFMQLGEIFCFFSLLESTDNISQEQGNCTFCFTSTYINLEPRMMHGLNSNNNKYISV